MKILQSSFFRAITAIAVGVLLIKYPDNTMTGIVIAIGVLFLLSGVVSVLVYLNARKHETDYKIFDAEGRQIGGQKPMLPIVGVGSVILGAVLALMPATFVAFLMYVIGGILILGAVNQYFVIIAARRYMGLSPWYWICPTLILLAGLYIIIKPMAPLSMAMLMLGWLSLFYGIVEAANSMLIFAGRRKWEKEQERLKAAEEAEEAKEAVEAKEADKAEEAEAHVAVETAEEPHPAETTGTPRTDNKDADEGDSPERTTISFV